jgi:hypothetical protein
VCTNIFRDESGTFYWCEQEVVGWKVIFTAAKQFCSGAYTLSASIFSVLMIQIATLSTKKIPASIHSPKFQQAAIYVDKKVDCSNHRQNTWF